MKLTDEVTTLRGVGSEVAAKLRTLGLQTIDDLIHYYPRRYDDYSQVQTISQLRPGVVTLQAQIKTAKGRYIRRGLHITEAVASDETGSVRIVWFNQPYRAASLKLGVDYYISGQFEWSRSRLTLMNPSVELVSDFPVNTARIVPIYRETKGLKSNLIRRLVREVSTLIKTIDEDLPPELVKKQRLMPRSTAILQMHFPDSSESLDLAKHRLGFEEIFELSLASLLNKNELKLGAALKIPFKQTLAKSFVDSLPFKLTDAQRRAIWQIYLDIEKEQPMNRLLEGDVGSGKTVVAGMAALMGLEQGFQAAFLAPTEILARQHAVTLHELFKPLGFEQQVGLLIGGLSASAKKAAQERIKTGDMKLIVGTHALIAEKVVTPKLGLVIIDEQHRFGVDQRKALQSKAGHAVHVLNMTATPIPRTLALTLYGDLDISILDILPSGRLPIHTKIVPATSKATLYKKIDAEIEKGRQVFVVCPLIIETGEGEAVETVYKRLSAKDFKHRKIGLLHGKLKSAEKEAVMKSFAAGKLDLLVSTTVIEVGVDVPNATIMVVEDAERFGLAQIHQLRGRVGRSTHQSYCYLITNDGQAPSRRLKALEQTTDGFKLAELDLTIRGPGAIYGTMQHGALDLRVASLTDVKLIAEARKAAQEFLLNGQNLLQYKQLAARVTRLRAITNLN